MSEQPGPFKNYLISSFFLSIPFSLPPVLQFPVKNNRVLLLAALNTFGG